MLPTVFDVLHDLGAVLSATGLRWYLFGAQAAILHGSARLSADVDVTVMMEPDRIDSLLDPLAERGIVPRNRDFREVATKHRVLLLWHESAGMPLDVVLGGTGIEEGFCGRARMHDLGGTSIPVISAEDLVASKVLAGRAKDLEDVRAIVQAGQGALDTEYVTQILRQFEQALDRGDLLSIFEEILKSWGQSRCKDPLVDYARARQMAGLQLHRTSGAQQIERRPLRSSFQAFCYRGLHVAPRDNIVRVHLMISDSPIDLGPLSISQRHIGAVSCNAVPDLFDERQSLLDSEAINSE